MSTLDKPLLESANWQLAHTWAGDLDLTFAGIPLPELLTYSMLNVLGRIEMVTAANTGLPVVEASEPTHAA